MADVLTTTRATRPGVYIGRVNRTNPTGLTGFARLPAYVGKGSRLRTVFNNAIRRSYLSDVSLTFPTIAPHLVTLVYPAVNDQSVARLFRSDGTIVPTSKWQFIESTPGTGVYDSVLLLPEAFDITVTYSLDYQSTSRLIKDVLPFSDIRQVRFVGDTENQDLYQEFVHYYIPITTSAITADTANANSTIADVGFEPARVVSANAGPFAGLASKVLNLTIDGTAQPPVAFSSAATTTAIVASEINAVIGTAGLALDNGSGQLEIRSASVDPGSSSIAVAGSAVGGALLDFTGTAFAYPASFPTGPMVTATFTSAGYMRDLTPGVPGVSNAYMAVESTSSSSHAYNRRYRLTVTSILPTVVMDLEVLEDSGAAFPEFAAGATLSAADAFGSAAKGTQPQLPMHSAVASTGTSLDFGASAAGVHLTPVTFTDVTGDTVKFILEEGVGGITSGSVFEATSLGYSFLELDSSLANTNQHASFSAVSEGSLTQSAAPYDVTMSSTAAVGNKGGVALSFDAEYTGSHNLRYLLVCTAATVAPTSPRTATFVWQAWGELDDLSYDGSARTFTIDEGLASTPKVDLGNGVFLDFTFDTTGGIDNFVPDAAFWFQANADRTFVSAKDDRAYQLEVAAIGATTTGNQVTLSYTTGTPEGGFGLPVVAGPQGKMFFAGGINTWLRNVGSQTTAANRYAIGDKWNFDTISDDVVDWSLTTLVTETIDPTQVVTDTLGVVTGTVGMKYAVLSNVPSSIRYAKDTATGALVASFSVSTTQPYIAFTSAPTSPVEVRYDYIGEEPAPAQLFYFTANTLRPAALYNTPIRVLDYDSAAQLLGPSSTQNDLLIMAQLALDDNGAPGAYFVQALDSDGDGVITSVDVNTAINATEDQRSLTDVIVLSSFGSLSTSLANNEKMNDPFERGERALWVGAPKGTAIGDGSVAGTLSYLASRTLQVYGNNHAHGKRVLVANNEATKTITLTDGTQVVASLDGSFVAGALAARNASFSDPGETLLRKNLFGFDSINTYTEPEELQLISFSIIYVSNVGSDTSPVYRIEESTTVDRSSDDNNEISVAINQKEFVTREIRTNMDTSLVSIVPPSEQAGVALIQSFLVSNLQSLLARGIIGAYTDSAGTSRPLDPDEDVKVFRAKDSRTAYNFQYFWNGRYPLKRLFGLYSVDQKFFGSQV